MRGALAQVDPELPVFEAIAAETLNYELHAQERLGTRIGTLFGAFGLLLAAVGLYGVMSFLVAQRTHEVAIRMAIGAEARDVVRMVVRRALILAGLGAFVGLALAAGVTRFAEALLYGVDPLDTAVFAAMAMTALLVAGVASFLPARRAARVDPMEALREE